MKTTDLMIIGGLALGAYFLWKNSSSGESWAGSSPSPPPATPTPTPLKIKNNDGNARGSGRGSGGGGGMSIRDNTYDAISGTIKISGQGYSVRPENVGKLISQVTTQKAQSAYSRINVNPYRGL